MINPFTESSLFDRMVSSNTVVTALQKKKVSGKVDPTQKALTLKRREKPKAEFSKDPHGKLQTKAEPMQVWMHAQRAKDTAKDQRYTVGSQERSVLPLRNDKDSGWEESQPEAEANLIEIEEPRRDPQSVAQVGVTVGGGLRNILAVLASATPEEKEFWATWYHQAQGEVKALAAHFKLDWKLVAAAVAALSPGSKWKTNLMSANLILQIFTRNPKADLDALMGLAQDFKVQTGTGIPAYSDNRRKAFYVLQTGDLAKIQTRKVWVFYRGLLDPDGVEKEIEDGSIDAKHRKMLNRKTTVDGHAINVWRGYKQPLDAMDSVSETLFDEIANDYETAAKMSGLSTRALQAITWYVWKYTQDIAPPDRIPLKSLDAHGNAQFQEPSKVVTKLIRRFNKEGTPLPGIPPIEQASRGPAGVWQWAPKKK